MPPAQPAPSPQGVKAAYLRLAALIRNMRTGDDERVSGAVSTASGASKPLAFFPTRAMRFQAPTLSSPAEHRAGRTKELLAYSLRIDFTAALSFFMCEKVADGLCRCMVASRCFERCTLDITLPVHTSERPGHAGNLRGESVTSSALFAFSPLRRELLMPFVHTPPGSDAAAMTSPPGAHAEGVRARSVRKMDIERIVGCRQGTHYPRRTARCLSFSAYALCARPLKTALPPWERPFFEHLERIARRVAYGENEPFAGQFSYSPVSSVTRTARSVLFSATSPVSFELKRTSPP